MKIKPCKKCGSTEVKLHDCGYSSFNPGGGTCKCGFKVTETLGCDPDKEVLIEVWNRGQKLNTEEKLKLERLKTRRLRRQIRATGLEPVE